MSVVHMNPSKFPFNALIVGPTNSGKTQFLVNQLQGPFRGKFDYIMLICPTFAYNKSLFRLAERDPRFSVIICMQHQVENWLKVVCQLFEGTNTLIIPDDQKITSITASFRENVAAIDRSLLHPLGQDHEGHL